MPAKPPQSLRRVVISFQAQVTIDAFRLGKREPIHHASHLRYHPSFPLILMSLSPNTDSLTLPSHLHASDPNCR